MKRFIESYTEFIGNFTNTKINEMAQKRSESGLTPNIIKAIINRLTKKTQNSNDTFMMYGFKVNLQTGTEDYVVVSIYTKETHIAEFSFDFLTKKLNIDFYKSIDDVKSIIDGFNNEYNGVKVTFDDNKVAHDLFDMFTDILGDFDFTFDMYSEDGKYVGIELESYTDVIGSHQLSFIDMRDFDNVYDIINLVREFKDYFERYYTAEDDYKMNSADPKFNRLYGEDSGNKKEAIRDFTNWHKKAVRCLKKMEIFRDKYIDVIKHVSYRDVSTEVKK